MSEPKTADERERRFVQYIATLNKGQLAEVKLRRLNRIANFRKAFMDLLNRMIETRAEDLAAGMMMEWARDREPRKSLELVEKKPPHKARLPKWVKDSSDAILNELKKK